MKRVLSLFLVLTMFASLVLTGCNKNSSTEENPTENATDVAKSIEFAENVAAMFGDYEFSEDELNIYIDANAPYIQQMVGAGEGWESTVMSGGLTARDTLINAAVEIAHVQHAILETVKADGLYTDEEDTAYFTEYVEGLGGEEEYRKFVRDFGFTEEAFRKFIACNGAYYALINSLCSDEDAKKLYDEKYTTAKHVLIQFEGRESEEAAYEIAKSVYDKAVAGESFEALVEKYNEDPGSADPEKAYTFVEGEMVTEFYEGARSLEIGDVSEPVKTTYGYHVIKRYPNPAEDSAEYGTYIANIKNMEISNYMTEEKTNEILEKYPLVVNEDIYRTVDLSRYTQTAEE